MENTEVTNHEQHEMPSNNMALAIVGTILGICSPICCLLGMGLGITAIVNASNVKKKFEAGDHAAAEKAAKNAKLFAIIAIALGVIGMIISSLTWESQMEQAREMMEKMGMEANF